MIRVVIPGQLRVLARIEGEIHLNIEGEATLGSVLDALEAEYPKLRGTFRDSNTKKRRPFIRFFMCGDDVSHEGHDAPLPREIVEGEEPFLLVGAVAGG